MATDKPTREQLHPWRDCSHGQGHVGAGLLLKGLGLWLGPRWSRSISEGVVPMEKVTLEKVHLKAPVAVDKSLPQQVQPWRDSDS